MDNISTEQNSARKDSFGETQMKSLADLTNPLSPENVSTIGRTTA